MSIMNANKAYGAIKGLAGSVIGGMNAVTDRLAAKTAMGVFHNKYLNEKLGKDVVLNATVDMLNNHRALGRGLAAGGLAGTAGIGALGYSAYNHFTD